MKTILMTLMMLLSGVAAATTSCATWSEMKAALEEGQSVILTHDIEQGYDSQIELTTSGDRTLDLNGYRIVGSKREEYRWRVFSITGAGAGLTLDDTSGSGGGIIDGQGVQRTYIGPYAGGGFLRMDSSTASFTLKGGTIANFRTAGAGGAIIANAGLVRITGGMITNCMSVGSGGGVCSLGPMEMSGGVVVDCVSEWSGGGVYVSGATMNLSGGEIAFNRSPAHGNGLEVASDLVFVMTGGRIHDNRDAGRRVGSLGGGGLYLSTSVSATISGGEILDNATALRGGGIYFHGKALTFAGGTLSGNAAAENGGGIYSDKLLAVTGGVISNNTANGSISAVYATGTSGQKVSGGIINGAIEAVDPAGCLTVDGGLFPEPPGCLAAGYAATPLPTLTPTTYIVGKGIGFTRGELSYGVTGFNPSERLYKEAGVTLAEGSHVTRCSTGYAIIAVRGTPLTGAVNEAIAFHGFLETADGKPFPQYAVVKIDFKLYPSANAGAELLWARRIPVTIGAGGGYYVDITDTAGQSYQAAGGVRPTCVTLREALARHARLAACPLWIAYEPVEATVATPFPRVPLYFQPLAQRASSAAGATVASVTSVRTSALAAADTATVSADRLVVDTDIVDVKGLSFALPHRDLALNAKGGAVKLRNVTGLNCSAATNTLGALLADLPATADSDCGRVVKHLVNGAETLTALYYSRGDSTTLPEGATNVYVWSFGPLIQK